ncbi:hypothetical protein WJX79_002367 [Trebouxia sp. C0005]
MRTWVCLLLIGLCVCEQAEVVDHDNASDIANVKQHKIASANRGFADQAHVVDENVVEDVQSDGKNAEPEWLLQLEDLLFSSAPSEQNKATAIEGLQLLYLELMEQLPVSSPKRKLHQFAAQDNSAAEEDDNVDPTELLDTEELASAADASFMLAVLAATGIATPHVSLNDSWAVKALHAAAQGGSPEAHLALAHRYFMGDGVPSNCQEGLRRARIVADEYVIATEGSASPELPLEPVSLRLRHRHGSYEDQPGEDSWIQLQLEAEMLNFGDGIERMMGYRQLLGHDLEANPAAALQHFQAIAAQGDAYATFNLGYMHMKGIGTQANATAAKASFEVAAREGIPSAFNGLGVLYFEGAGGGSVDHDAAREAFVSGSKLGDPDAMFNLATMYAGGHGVAKNHSLAHEHYLDAHDAGHWRAPHALAIAHHRGLGVRPNCTAAKEYIQTFIKERSSWSDQMDEALLAVNAGSEWLALMRLLSQAAQGDLPDAWVDAGNIQYGNQQPGEAARLFTLAAASGSIEGLYSLGWMHAVGQGVPRNKSRAAELYRQAMEQAPDWRHAAPPFVALLLLPFLSAWQWLQPMSSAVFGLQSSGLHKGFKHAQDLKLAHSVLQFSCDTWVLTAAAASLAWVMWRRHKRMLQMQSSSTQHTRADSETGVG